LEEANLYQSVLTGADFSEAHLDQAYLRGASLEGADFNFAYLDRAVLIEAHMEGAVLRFARLGRADLIKAHLEGTILDENMLRAIRQWRPDFPRRLPPADLRGAFLDTGTTLEDVNLGNPGLGFALLGDVRWGDANLAVVNWQSLRMLGDEQIANQRNHADGTKKTRKNRIDDYENAARANRQVAAALRS
jgi:uncharacterized protein YjbI with pentapeptide repeats